MVWASIYNAIVKNDVAVFIGHDVNYDSKLFTVKAPELPMDITSEVLRRWSQSSGKDFAEALKFGNVGFIHDNGTTIQVTFTFWGQKYETWPREFQLDSKMISEIMHDVKGKGVVRKTSVYGKSYSFLEKEVKPEVQK